MSEYRSAVSHARERLLGLTRDLLSEWQETRPAWRDRRAREFDRDTMQPLFDSVDRAAEAMEDLDRMLNRLRKDCGDE